MSQAGIRSESLSPDQLFSGRQSTIMRSITVKSGEGALARGTVLGRVSTGGKYVKSLAASNDGSEAPVAVLAYPVDATSGDVTATAYYDGDFNPDKLVFGTGHTAASVDAAWLNTPKCIKALQGA